MSLIDDIHRGPTFTFEDARAIEAHVGSNLTVDEDYIDADIRDEFPDPSDARREYLTDLLNVVALAYSTDASRTSTTAQVVAKRARKVSELASKLSLEAEYCPSRDFGKIDERFLLGGLSRITSEQNGGAIDAIDDAFAAVAKIESWFSQLAEQIEDADGRGALKDALSGLARERLYNNLRGIYERCWNADAGCSVSSKEGKALAPSGPFTRFLSSTVHLITHEKKVGTEGLRKQWTRARNARAERLRNNWDNYLKE